MFAIGRRLGRVWTVYRDLGPAAVTSRIRHRVRRLFGSDDPAHAEWLAQKTRVDEQFDREYGTQTGGVQEIFGYTIAGNNRRHGLSHIASDPDQFTHLLAKLEVDLSTYRFIDLGAGKGRALFLATQLPFRRITGVEFASELVETAKANIARLAFPDYGRIELICGDATEYIFPDEPLVVYLFNPFGSAVIRAVAENLIASWRRMPRPIYVLYMNAVHLEDFLEAGWVLTDAGIGAILIPGS